MGSVGSALVPRGCLSLSHYLRKRACASSNFYSWASQGTTLLYNLATVATDDNFDTDSRGAADLECVLAAFPSVTGPLRRQLRLIS